jgi:hypothetical protein
MKVLSALRQLVLLMHPWVQFGNAVSGTVGAGLEQLSPAISSVDMSRTESESSPDTKGDSLIGASSSSLSRFETLHNVGHQPVAPRVPPPPEAEAESAR